MSRSQIKKGSCCTLDGKAGTAQEQTLEGMHPAKYFTTPRAVFQYEFEGAFYHELYSTESD